MVGVDSVPLERAFALPPGFYLGADMLAQDRSLMFTRSLPRRVQLLLLAGSSGTGLHRGRTEVLT